MKRTKEQHRRVDLLTVDNRAAAVALEHREKDLEPAHVHGVGVECRVWFGALDLKHSFQFIAGIAQEGVHIIYLLVDRLVAISAHALREDDITSMVFFHLTPMHDEIDGVHKSMSLHDCF